MAASGAAEGDAKLTTLDVLPLSRTAAREIGTVTLKTKSQPAQEITGKYAVVWRKVGGKWKLATDIWNDDTRNDISDRGSNEPSGGGIFDSFRRHKPR